MKEKIVFSFQLNRIKVDMEITEPQNATGKHFRN